MRLFVAIVFVFVYSLNCGFGQDSSKNRIGEDYLNSVSSDFSQLEQRVERKTSLYLTQFKKEYQKLYRKLLKKDSTVARNLEHSFNTSIDKLNKDLSDARDLRAYIPKLDSISSSLKFFKKNPAFLSSARNLASKLESAELNTDKLKLALQKSELVKKFLQDQKKFLVKEIDKLGLAKHLKGINKSVYYFSQQVKEFRELLKDRKKVEKKALALLSKSKLFRDFMKKHSMLASLFRLPDEDNPIDLTGLLGLQTRASTTVARRLM